MRLVEAVGKRIESLLEERNMTCYKLSKEGGIARQTIAEVIRGKNKTVSLNVVFQITATLGLSLEEFFKDKIFDEVDE